MTETLFALMLVLITDNNVGEKNLFRARTFIFYIQCVKQRIMQLCAMQWVCQSYFADSSNLLQLETRTRMELCTRRQV